MPDDQDTLLREQLFRWVMLDLDACTRSPVRYHRLRIAGLTRLLIVDGAKSLALQVNRTYRRSLEFRVGSYLRPPPADAPPQGFVPDFQATGEFFDPEVVPEHPMASESVNLDRLLKLQLIRSGSAVVTVGELIDNMAHVVGAMHAGAPTSDVDAQLLSIRWGFESFGKPMLPALLRSVGAVVNRGLRPLLEDMHRARFPPGTPIDSWHYA